jgi:hypothetical protein
MAPDRLCGSRLRIGRFDRGKARRNSECRSDRGRGGALQEVSSGNGQKKNSLLKRRVIENAIYGKVSTGYVAFSS